jgi:hypothetical protein
MRKLWIHKHGGSDRDAAIVLFFGGLRGSTTLLLLVAFAIVGTVIARGRPCSPVSDQCALCSLEGARTLAFDGGPSFTTGTRARLGHQF